MNPLETYKSGASVRATAKIHGMSETTVRRRIARAGITRTRSEAQCVAVKGGELILHLKKNAVTIRSPYFRPQWFSNIDFKGRR